MARFLLNRFDVPNDRFDALPDALFVKAQPPLERVAPDGHFHRSVGLHGTSVDDAMNQRVVEHAAVVLRKLSQIRGTMTELVAGRAVSAAGRAMTTRAIEKEQPTAGVNRLVPMTLNIIWIADHRARARHSSGSR